MQGGEDGGKDVIIFILPMIIGEGVPPGEVCRVDTYYRLNLRQSWSEQENVHYRGDSVRLANLMFTSGVIWLASPIIRQDKTKLSSEVVGSIHLKTLVLLSEMKIAITPKRQHLPNFKFS